MRQPLRFLAITAFSLALAEYSEGGDFSKEEQALIKKNMVMQMYKPDEHSRHFVAHITTATDPKTGKPVNLPSKSPAVVCFVFGIEDATPTRNEGRSMAECKYSPQQAHEFLFAEGWNKYHDRFFTRCYVQEGENAYDEAVKAQQKPADQSTSS